MKLLWCLARPVLIWLTVQVLITYVLLNALAYVYFLRPRRVFQASMTPRTYSWRGPIDFEDVTFSSRGDNLKLAGWYMPKVGARRAIVLVHGKDGSRTDEFFGRYVEFAAGLHNAGFAVMMIDLRGHGKSADAFVSFGIHERRDVLGAVDWLETRGFKRPQIGLHGVSLGGAAVLGAMADDAGIGAVVSDSAFSDVVGAARFQWTRLTRTPGQLHFPGLLLAQRQSGVDYWAARPVVDAAKIAAQRVMLIQGLDDLLVPLEQARALQQALPGATVWEVADADHGGAYREVPIDYLARVTAFYERALPALR